MSCVVTHWTGRVSANTRPHQLHWGDWEMGTAISYTKCSQVAGLIQKIGRSSSKAPSLHAAVLCMTFFCSRPRPMWQEMSLKTLRPSFRFSGGSGDRTSVYRLSNLFSVFGMRWHRTKITHLHLCKLSSLSAVWRTVRHCCECEILCECLNLVSRVDNTIRANVQAIPSKFHSEN